MIRCLATMGTSPPVVTEFVAHISKFEKIRDIVILSTAEPSVYDSAVLTKAALADRYPQVKVKIEKLGLNDILSEDDNYLFMSETAKILHELKGEGWKVYVCLAGGRKEMVASMVLLAQLANVDSLFHVVSPDVKALNIELEKIRPHISACAQSSDPLQYYREHRSAIEPVMYPPPDSYNVVKLPILPYPSNILREIKRILSSDYTYRNRARLEDEYIIKLRQTGLIRVAAGKIITTDEGRKFHESVLKNLA